MSSTNLIIPTEWQTAIENSLKGQSVSELITTLKGIEMPAFAHSRPANSPRLQQLHQPWQIADTFEIGQDLKALNQEIIAGLVGGLEAIGVESVGRVMMESDWQQVFQDVRLDFISCHSTIDPDGAQLDALYRATSGEINGTIIFKESDLERYSNLQSTCFRLLPHMRCVALTIDLNGNLVEAFRRFKDDLHRHLSFWSSRPALPKSVVASKFFANVFLSRHYLLDIACLRAIRVIWSDMLEQARLPFGPLLIRTSLAPANIKDDIHYNMIAAAIQTLSAVLGGSDVHFNCIALQPNAFQRRIARNQQHVLRLESGLGVVHDPLAGSYCIEQLTDQIVNSCKT